MIESQLTVCVTGRWVGVDKIWEQKKIKARKLLDAKHDDESHLPKRSEGVHAVLAGVFSITLVRKA
jgi:hypothetical protein